jgi:hypothetical protein
MVYCGTAMLAVWLLLLIESRYYLQSLEYASRRIFLDVRLLTFAAAAGLLIAGFCVGYFRRRMFQADMTEDEPLTTRSV